MRQETDGVLLESYLIYEPEHQATWFKDGEILLGALDFDEKYQVKQTKQKFLGWIMYKMWFFFFPLHIVLELAVYIFFSHFWNGVEIGPIALLLFDIYPKKTLEITLSVYEINMEKKAIMSDFPWKTKMNLQSMQFQINNFITYVFFFKNIFSTEYPVELNPPSSENPHPDKKVSR